MARKSGRGPLKGIADSLHVKRNTAGTSNELSLSVLEERSKNADDQASSTPLPARLNKVSVFAVQSKKSRKEKASGGSSSSSSSVASPLDLSSHGRAARARKRALDDPAREIKRRKSVRRARRIAATVFVIAASCALLGFASLNIWQTQKANEENMTLLGQAMKEIEAADEVVLAADALVTDGLGEASSEDVSSLESDAENARTHINAALAFAESASENMDESPAREASLKVQSSAAARSSMLDDALLIIDEEMKVRDASAVIDECWQRVLSADTLLKEAAALVTETTNENVRSSQEKSEEARALLEEAGESLESAQEIYPGADFSLLSSYIEKRIEAIGYAIASDEAIYIQDKATADEQNALYNQADAEAVEIAQSLPDDPKEPLLDALDETTKDARDRYAKTREAAAQSDAYIRDYLGESQ